MNRLSFTQKLWLPLLVSLVALFSISVFNAYQARQIRLDELVTTTTVLALDRLLSEDSTFYGDLFPHAVKWKGIVYLEDGLHRAVRAALRNRTVLHARVFDMDMPVAKHA